MKAGAAANGGDFTRWSCSFVDRAMGRRGQVAAWRFSMEACGLSLLEVDRRSWSSFLRFVMASHEEMKREREAIRLRGCEGKEIEISES